ncbi:unnamed protein product, partial [Phaeothamnion confervicola]
MVLRRQAATGRSLLRVFRHFDRSRSGWVGPCDAAEALKDLRIAVPAAGAAALVAFCYGDFATLVADPHHGELERELCRQMAAQLETVGPSYRLAQVFRRRRGECLDGDGGAEELEEWMPAPRFAAALAALGLRLDAVDMQRLLHRFDLHGDGRLSPAHFLTFCRITVFSSPEWRHAAEEGRRQAAAEEEAATVTVQRRECGRWPVPGLSSDLVAMARRLGISVVTDSHLLHVAAEALAAPLPAGWSVAAAADGRRCYLHAEAGISRWDHPLDAHYRAI